MRVYSVSEINRYIKAVLDTQPSLKSIFVGGELSNLSNRNSSGHIYFTLKDETSAMKGVMFASYAANLAFHPENGLRVIVRGRITCFERDGVYQIYAEDMTPDGLGAYHLAFEQTRDKLAAEGLFAPERKRPLPAFPESVGVVTAAGGAVIHDISTIASRRFPLCRIFLYPAAVQGASAEAELCEGIDYFSESGTVSTVILARGGGSAEDLHPFNSERLARKISSCKVPVISAVGHETDYTIADFAADLRAATPSAAAELLFPDSATLKSNLEAADFAMKGAIQRKITALRTSLSLLSSRPCLQDPVQFHRHKRERLNLLSERLRSGFEKSLEKKRLRLSLGANGIEGRSPLSTLMRGYALVYHNEELLRSSDCVAPGDYLRIRLAEGEIHAQVCKEDQK